MSDYPMHDKLTVHGDEYDAIVAFLCNLYAEGHVVASYKQGHLVETNHTNHQLALDFLDIDRAALEAEKKDMLKKQREANNAD